MSDYKSMRSKKNAETQNAMSTVRKDLYDWKRTANMLKLNRESSNLSVSSSGRTTPSTFPHPLPKSTTSTLVHQMISSNRSSSLSSLSDLAKPASGKTNPPSSSTKIRPLTTKLHNKQRSDELSPRFAPEQTQLASASASSISGKRFEFIDTFKKKTLPTQTGENSKNNNNSNRVYLNSARSVMGSTKRDPRKTEQELVVKLNKKESLSVFEMDLSQFDLKSIKNLEKVKI